MECQSIMLGQVTGIQLLGQKPEILSHNFGIQILPLVESVNQVFCTVKIKLYLNFINSEGDFLYGCTVKWLHIWENNI